MSQKYYYNVKVCFPNKDITNLKFLEKIAFEKYFCLGVQEYTISEKDVDEILGDRAHISFNIDDEVYDLIENKVRSLSDGIYLFFFDGENAKSYAESFLKESSKIFTDISFFLIEAPYEDWNKKWREFYKEISIDKKLSIIPSWFRDNDTVSNDDKQKKVFINPGQGFGTGNHETTFLCLKMLANIDLKNPKCCDFGCGSGILGIAAMKLYNAEVDFCDIDIEALENCKENLVLNFRNEKLNNITLVSRNRFTPENKDYDLVFANILYPVLLEEKETLLSVLKSGAYLIVSGLLEDQLDDLKKEYLKSDKTLLLEEERIKGDWGALLFKRL